MVQIERPGWGERHAVSEILRVRACALAQAGDFRESDSTFEQALRAAREQNARSLELRAAVGYARSLAERRRAAEAISILRPVYDWFTEGHDTKDLREAAALLAELSTAGVGTVAMAPDRSR